MANNKLHGPLPDLRPLKQLQGLYAIGPPSLPAYVAQARRVSAGTWTSTASTHHSAPTAVVLVLLALAATRRPAVWRGSRSTLQVSPKHTRTHARNAMRRHATPRHATPWQHHRTHTRKQCNATQRTATQRTATPARTHAHLLLISFTEPMVHLFLCWNSSKHPSTNDSSANNPSANNLHTNHLLLRGGHHECQLS